MPGLSVSARDLSYSVPLPPARGGGWFRSLRRSRGDGGDGGDGGARGALPRREILRGVTMDARPGELLAVLSASGGGKTSLLNVLSGRAGRSAELDGRVLFDGRERDARVRRRIGFCTQDDCFFPGLTVRETLEFTAGIVVGDAGARAARVEDAIARFGLVKCAETRIGSAAGGARGVSGGERRRTSLANEMLASPDLYLADEPTSGLDSTTAYSVMRVLKEYAAEGGRSVIATVHQPSPALGRLFDRVLLLSEGEVVWTGPAAEMEPWFAACGYPFPPGYNPWDYVLQLLIEGEVEVVVDGAKEGADPDPVSDDSTDLTTSGKSAATEDAESPRDRLVRMWRDRGMKGGGGVGAAVEDELGGGEAPRKTLGVLGGMRRAVTKRAGEVLRSTPESEGPPKYATSFWSQTRSLARRSLIQKRGVVFERVALVQVLITMSTSVFWWRLGSSERFLDDRTGAVAFFTAFWSFTASLIALHAFPTEKDVLNKDRAAGMYRLSAYYVGKNLVETPLDVIYPLLFSLITYFVIGFSLSFQQFILFWVILSLVVLSATSAAYAVSAAVMHMKWAQIITTGYLLWGMMLGGYYSDVNNQTGVLRALSYVSTVRYGYVAFVRNEFAGNTFECEQDDALHTVYSEAGRICPITEEAALRGAQVADDVSIAGCCGMMLLIIVVFRVSGYLALKYLHTQHKAKL